MSSSNPRTKKVNRLSSGAIPTTTKGGSIRLFISAQWDNIQSSLFFAPFIGVLGAIGLAIGLINLDDWIEREQLELPSAFAATVDSSRAVLSTIAGALISFAGTAFSVSLLVFQMASGSYSPRIVNTLFKDPFNRRIMGLIVGCFTYCLVVLRAVRNPTEDEETSRVPTISVNFAIFLGIVSILALVAFIDHSAHAIDVSEILETVTRDAIIMLSQSWRLYDELDEDELKHRKHIEELERINWTEHPDPHEVLFIQSGWVQEVNVDGLKSLVPDGGHIKLHTISGRYSIPGCAICSVYGLNKDSSEDYDLEAYDQSIRNCIAIGRNRTIRDDPTFGLRQIVDVTLRALSPGVNDPTTAQDGIFHAAAVVIEFLKREPPLSAHKTENGGTLILEKQFTHDDIVLLAYNEVRVCAVSSPTVCKYLIESLRLIRESLIAVGLRDRAFEIERQVQHIEEGSRKVGSHVKADHEFVTKARVDRFPDLLAPETPKYKDVL
jgi:uncharacterized membrane protein